MTAGVPGASCFGDLVSTEAAPALVWMQAKAISRAVGSILMFIGILLLDLLFGDPAVFMVRLDLLALLI